jgi:iron(II)-dependent oxidoreductase
MNQPDRLAVADSLIEIRDRTLQLISGLSADALARQHDPLMSPIIWDLGHIGAFEELWLVRRLGAVSSESELDAVYDAFRTPRSRRGDLSLPDGESLLERLSAVRMQALSLLETVDFDPDNPLLANAFAYEMVIEHEAQHQETILQTLTLMQSESYEPSFRLAGPPATAAEPGEMIEVPGGPFFMGAPEAGFAYDNERPRHRAETTAFEIGRYPVTNAEYIEFLAAGGYEDRNLWTDAGWHWKEVAGLVAPMYWEAHGGVVPGSPAEATRLARDGGPSSWQQRTSLGVEPLQPSHPVIHVCCYEAEAYARFVSARLPSETEWEKAAAWDPVSEQPRLYPWGDQAPAPGNANLDQGVFGPAAIGSFPQGASALGCEQMLGDVWEWTSSSLSGYPGFEAFPYPEYSEVFFGSDYRVLRGGSWATRSEVSRNSFRNWDYPIRRQIFAGFRIARDD